MKQTIFSMSSYVKQVQNISTIICYMMQDMIIIKNIQNLVALNGWQKRKKQIVRNILKNEPFGSQKISKIIKTSDAKLFLRMMQQEDGRGHSTIKTVRGVLRPAFQMAVDDDVLMKNPFLIILSNHLEHILFQRLIIRI